MSFEIDPPSKKKITWLPFCGRDLFKFTQNVLKSFLQLFHMHTKFQVPAISNRNYIFFSSGVP